jgi:DNA repair protein RecO (recombination protein O)
VIVTIFTDEFGLQSYIVNGVRSKTTKSRIALYQPLTLVELVVYHRENANLNRIKEIKCLHPYQTLHLDVIKSSVGLFVAEVINKTVKEESHAKELCEFLISSLVTLDTSSYVNNFHLIFLLKLSGFLGFGAQNVNEVLGPRITEPAIEEAIQRIINGDYNVSITLSGSQRRELLKLIIDFYNEHTGMLGEMKSLQVLREVLM